MCACVLVTNYLMRGAKDILWPELAMLPTASTPAEPLAEVQVWLNVNAIGNCLFCVLLPVTRRGVSHMLMDGMQESSQVAASVRNLALACIMSWGTCAVQFGYWSTVQNDTLERADLKYTSGEETCPYVQERHQSCICSSIQRRWHPQ